MKTDSFYGFKIRVWHPNQLDITRIHAYLLNKEHHVKIHSLSYGNSC